MSTSEVDSRNVTISMRKSVENLVISSQDAIGQSISQALTFSGVIAQHNQVIHENKSVSRSPSPSLRHTDSTLDILDNDKSSESSLHGAGDVAAIVDGNLAPPSLKSDTKLSSSNPSTRGADGAAVRTKKKSWYNSLYPTYKNKSDDFKRLFKDLPDDERLIVDYSCALQKDILAHGRLYASQNYLCFYASIFGWETSLTLRWKDVTAITKEKTALVIPNAILVCTEGEKNFLTSFSGRDKAYLMLFRIWQNALMDQPMTSQEIWQWVHTCYGDELGFNSDDEGYARDCGDEPPPPDTSEEAIDSSSMEASGGAGDRPHDSSPLRVTNGGPREDEAGDALPTDMSDTSDSEPDKNHNNGEMEKCTSSHEGKLLLRQEFPFNIDQMFTMIFTNSRFNLELLAARSTTDYVQAPWQPQNGLKCRQISYTLGLTSGPIGPKEVHVTEVQVMNKCSKPGALYSIDATSENAGIPYADYFSVQVHYCLQRTADCSTRLTLYGYVKYKKTMWPMIKAFLEKNTMSGLEEYGRLLDSRLAAEARPPAPAARARHRRRRHDVGPARGLAPAAPAAPPAAAPRARLLPLLLAALLLLNALLAWRLYRATQRHLDLDHLHDR
ncbi:protein Aster-B-like isoform X3 [Epargyreus clarus]|uniref:protein Aster-B-like isoform X3 n=1 Tax=Epargyreus clarus TaxID=520877 RepID=UPI003C2CEE00